MSAQHLPSLVSPKKHTAPLSASINALVSGDFLPFTPAPVPVSELVDRSGAEHRHYQTSDRVFIRQTFSYWYRRFAVVPLACVHRPVPQVIIHWAYLHATTNASGPAAVVVGGNRCGLFISSEWLLWWWSHYDEERKAFRLRRTGWQIVFAVVTAAGIYMDGWLKLDTGPKFTRQTKMPKRRDWRIAIKQTSSLRTVSDGLACLRCDSQSSDWIKIGGDTA